MASFVSMVLLPYGSYTKVALFYSLILSYASNFLDFSFIILLCSSLPIRPLFYYFISSGDAIHYFNDFENDFNSIKDSLRESNGHNQSVQNDANPSDKHVNSGVSWADVWNSLFSWWYSMLLSLSSFLFQVYCTSSLFINVYIISILCLYFNFYFIASSVFSSFFITSLPIFMESFIVFICFNLCFIFLYRVSCFFNHFVCSFIFILSLRSILSLWVSQFYVNSFLFNNFLSNYISYFSITSVKR